MCGIVGWIDYKKGVQKGERIIARMNNSLAHRGPDEEGIWTGENVFLGHRRLVVLDPAGGKQPMIRSKGENNYVIVYNGELYNSSDLRNELEKKGYVFKSNNSDTEVVLLSYIEWKEECLSRFNGIYAFAIWDETKKELFLARDRLGIKPLFYWQSNQSLVFASEIKALFLHPYIKAAVDKEGIAELLAMGPLRIPGSAVFKGIKEVPPANYIFFNSGSFKICPYWQLPSEQHKDDLEATCYKIKSLVEDAVKIQLNADVPVCTLLSGGLDSSIITALAASEFYKTGCIDVFASFSVGYKDNEKYFIPNQFEKDLDDFWSQEVARFLNIKNYKVLLDNEMLCDVLDETLAANDLPGMADIDTSLYLFCSQIKKYATVALSGECADEIFGGYPWFDLISVGKNDGTFPWIRMLKQREEFLHDYLKEKVNLTEYAHICYKQALNNVPQVYELSSLEQKMCEISYLSINYFMPTLLNRKDRMSMAWGLEIRIPFSDHRLVEYVWNLPINIKRWRNFPKGILRKAVEGFLPNEVIYRPKSPYPKTHNPQYEKRVKLRFAQILKNKTEPLFNLYDRKKLDEYMEKGTTIFPLPWFGQLMGDIQYLAYLIQLNEWIKKYNVNIFI